MNPDSLCRWQVQVSVYCAWRMPAHRRCPQCSILLHLMDICFQTCIGLWHISQIQTCLCVVIGTGFVSTSPAFMRSNASHQRVPISTQCAQQFCIRCASPLVGCVVWSHCIVLRNIVHLPHILLLRPVLFPSHPAQPMSHLYSSHLVIAYALKNTCISVSLIPHTH